MLQGICSTSKMCMYKHWDLQLLLHFGICKVIQAAAPAAVLLSLALWIPNFCRKAESQQGVQRISDFFTVNSLPNTVKVCLLALGPLTVMFHIPVKHKTVFFPPLPFFQLYDTFLQLVAKLELATICVNAYISTKKKWDSIIYSAGP